MKDWKVHAFCFFVFVIYLLAIASHYLYKSPTAASYFFDFGIISIVAVIGFFFSSAYLNAYYLVTFSIVILFFLIQYFFISDIYHFSVFEFLRSSRFAVYLCFLLFITKVICMKRGEDKSTISVDTLWKIYLVLGSSMLLVYLFKSIFLDNARPTFFSENNFEVPSLIIFSLIVYRSSVKLKLEDKALKYLYILIAFLSFSKSGFLSAFFSFSFDRKISTRQIILLPFFIVLACFAFSFILYQRGDVPIDEWDRFKFLTLFYQALMDGEWYNILFGYGIASELPTYYCSSLSYFAVINENPDHCNAIIFHSFFMRVIYDFGIFGLLFTLLTWLYCLIVLFGIRCAILIFGVLSIASLSISSFSNSIVIWPIYLYCFFVLLSRSSTRKLHFDR